MANYKTSIKDIRQNKKRRTRNRAHRSKVKTLLTKVRSELNEQAPKEQVTEDFKLFAKYMDKAAHRNLYHPKKAARLKSRLAKQINNLEK